jgi:hypothetical protein
MARTCPRGGSCIRWGSVPAGSVLSVHAGSSCVRMKERGNRKKGKKEEKEGKMWNFFKIEFFL